MISINDQSPKVKRQELDVFQSINNQFTIRKQYCKCTSAFQQEERQQWKLEKDTELRLEIPEGKGKAELVVSCTFDYLGWLYTSLELEQVSEVK